MLLMGIIVMTIAKFLDSVSSTGKKKTLRQNFKKRKEMKPTRVKSRHKSCRRRREHNLPCPDHTKEKGERDKILIDHQEICAI